MAKGFVKVQGHGVHALYVCLVQNPFTLSRLLWSRAKPFALESKPRSKNLRRLPAILFKMYRIARLVLPVVMYKLGSSPSEDSQLSRRTESANLAMKMRIGGYKLFDLEKGTVVTLFPPEFDLNIVKKQIERACEAGKHTFAPAVRSWDIEARRYEEVFINAHPLALHSGDWWSQLNDYLMPLLETLIVAAPPNPVDLRSYVAAKKDYLEEAMGSASSILQERSDLYKIGLIRAFVEKMSERLGSAPCATVYLSLSHGDMHAGNVLMTNAGPVAIDWNNLDFKSVLYDLYMILFRKLRPVRQLRPAYTPGSEVATIAVTMRQAIEHLQERLAQKKPALPGQLISSLVARDVYRQLFYIEFVCKGVEKLQQTTNQQATSERLDHTIAWIQNFEDYETMLERQVARVLPNQ